jgi:hypothetical protein
MKKMPFLLTLLTLIAVVSGVEAIQKPSPEPAQSTAPEKPMMRKTEKFYGTIEKVDETGKMIAVRGKRTNEEKTLTFTIRKQTKITKGKGAMSLGDLRKEMWVSIDYEKDKDEMIAVAIEVSTP